MSKSDQQYLFLLIHFASVFRLQNATECRPPGGPGAVWKLSAGLEPLATGDIPQGQTSGFPVEIFLGEVGVKIYPKLFPAFSINVT